MFIAFPSVVSARNHQSVCDLKYLERNPYPAGSNWNYTEQFSIKNTANYPMTFDWLLDMWDAPNADQYGTKNLNPGETAIFGLGAICSKWQLDISCGGKEWGAIVESHANACIAATPTPVPSSTPEIPTTESSKESAMALTDPTCVDNNMVASIVLTKNSEPISGINVKFIYENEAKYAKTEANGRAGVLFGYKADSEVIIEPEDGFPTQRQRAHGITSCPQSGDVLGTVTGASFTSEQILGMADTGVIEDVIANFAGIAGTLSTVVGSVLYAKTKKSTRTK